MFPVVSGFSPYSHALQQTLKQVQGDYIRGIWLWKNNLLVISRDILEEG